MDLGPGFPCAALDTRSPYDDEASLSKSSALNETETEIGAKSY